MRKCPHGIYWPEGHPKATCCQFCNPDGNPVVPGLTISFNRRGSLAMTETGQLPKCPNCQGTAILAVSNGGKCVVCHTEYDIIAPTNLRANNKQPGLCECGSGVHIELDRRTWQCADCGKKYKAPKRRE